MKKIVLILCYLEKSIMCYAAGVAEGLMSYGAAAAYAQAQKEKEQAITVVVVILIIILAIIIIYVTSHEKKTNITISHDSERIHESPSSETVNTDEMRECPFCAELIKKKAKLCRFCGKDVVPLEENNNQE